MLSQVGLHRPLNLGAPVLCPADPASTAASSTSTSVAGGHAVRTVAASVRSDLASSAEAFAAAGLRADANGLLGSAGYSWGLGRCWDFC